MRLHLVTYLGQYLFGVALNSCSTVAFFSVKTLGNFCDLLCEKLHGEPISSESPLGKIHYYRGETCNCDS